MSAEERLRLEFNEWARAGRGAKMERGHRPVGEQAVERMNVDAQARALDMGCGSGWATRLLASLAREGEVVGIDISDEMVRQARSESLGLPNVEYRVASAAHLPFKDGEFTHVFSMESLYYYPEIDAALREARRVLAPGGMMVAVVDMYMENAPSLQWVAQLNVPVHLLSASQYTALFRDAGFSAVTEERLYDLTPIPEDYSGDSFATRDDYVRYRELGSLMISGRVKR